MNRNDRATIRSELEVGFFEERGSRLSRFGQVRAFRQEPQELIRVEIKLIAIDNVAKVKVERNDGNPQLFARL